MGNENFGDLSDRRQSYARGGLDERDLEADPMAMFARWYDDAEQAGLYEPNAMVIATASSDGLPSARFVLLKSFDAEGFVFFSNYESRKGREIEANPRVALTFPWIQLERQVRVEGRAERVSREETVAYAQSRPRASQLGAWASRQSTLVANRFELDAAYAAVEARFEGVQEIPPPDYWGGYRVVPDQVEFWQGRIGRMHDRLVYQNNQDQWQVERLAP